MRIQFQIHLPSAEVFPWEHAGSRLTIGRLPECDLSFRGPVGEIVSGRHALVELSASGALLTDLGSTNGTFLNGIRLARPAVLKVGDQVLLGQAGPRLDVLAVEVPSLAAAPQGPPALPIAGGQAVKAPAAMALPVQSGVPSPIKRPLPTIAWIAAAVAVLAGGIWIVGAIGGARTNDADAMARVTKTNGETQKEDFDKGPNDAPPIKPDDPSPPGPPVPPPSPPPPAVEIDEKPWMAADLVLVNPVHFAVALEQFGEPAGYKLLAKAEGEAAALAAEVAWQSGISIIADEAALTRRIYDRSNLGEPLDKADAADLNRKWREFRIVPNNSTVVVFNDLKQRRTRLGYLAPAREFDPAKSEELWFRDVRGKQAEPFERDYVQAGTLRKGLSDNVLVKTAGIDFLDYCLHHLAAALCPPPEKRDALNVYVVGDISAVARPEHRYDMAKDYPRFAPRGDEERMRSEADRLVRESERLASELRGRLNDLGVPVAEWSKEMAFGSYDSDFRRPEFKEAHDGNLLGISHVLLFRVRTPHTRGMYELSMRLVDVERGRLLWEGQADRPRPEESNFDLAASPYLMHTGKLALLELASDKAAIDPSTRAWSRGGVPLLLPEIKLKSESVPSDIRDLKQTPRPKRPWQHTYNNPEEMWGQHLRLGYLESSGESESEHGPILFRDLFSSRIQTIPRDAVSGIGEIETDGEIPPAHEMRYYVWRLAKFILPTAGRVTEVHQQRAKLTLCRRDGVKQGDRLTVRRLSGSTSEGLSASEVVLPHELILTDVTDADSVANIERLEGYDVQEALSVESGDIVHRRPAGRIVVGVLRPRVDMNAAMSLGMHKTKTPAGDYIDVNAVTQWIGDQLCQILQNAMVRLQLPVVERSELQVVIDQQKNENFDVNPTLAAGIGRAAGATHVILSDISPGLYHEARVGLRVVEVDTGMVIEQINFKFKRAQFESWMP